MASSSSSSSSRSSFNGGSSHGFNGLTCIRRWTAAAKKYRVKHCACGLECEYYTAMTNENPGRRFCRCPKQKMGGCGLWEWVDEPMCNLGTQLFPLMREEINGLRSSLNAKDVLIENLERNLRRSHDLIVKLEQDLEFTQHEANSCLEEAEKLSNEKSMLARQLVKEKRERVCSLMIGVVLLLMALYFLKEFMYYDL